MEGRRFGKLLLPLSLACFAGCIAPSTPAPIHYFLPPVRDESATPAKSTAAPPSARAPELHRGAVTAAAQLRERQVWRVSAVELAFDDANHWAADPAAIVADALDRALFVAGGLAPAAGLRAPVLEAHVAAFEGDLVARVAVVEIHAVLSRPGEARRWQRDIRRERPLEKATPATLAREIGLALRDCAAATAAWARAAVTEPAAEAR